MLQKAVGDTIIRRIGLVIFTIILGCHISMSEVYAYTPVSATVTAESAKIRAEANTTSSVLGGITKGASITISNEVAGSDGKTWYEVTVSGTTKGYVRADLVTKGTNATTSSASTSTSSTTDAGKIGTIISNGAKVRGSASTTGTVATAVSKGTTVTIVSSEKDSGGATWYKVKTSEGTSGYIRSDLMTVSAATSTGTSTSSTANTTVKIGTIIANSVRVRSTAATTGSLVAALIKGNTVTLGDSTTGTDGATWYKVTLSNGSTGYIRSDLMSISSSTVASATTSNSAGTTISKTGTVIGTSIRVRNSASTTGSIEATVTQGDKVTVGDSVTGADNLKWYKVMTSSGVAGYIRADLITVTTTTVTKAVSSSVAGATGTISGSNVCVRNSASTTATMVTTVNKGTVVTISDSTTGTDAKTWYKVTFSLNGKSFEGYIRSDLMTVDTSSISTASSTTKTGAGTATIKGTGVRIRTYASTSADARCALDNGTQVSITSSSTGTDDGKTWYLITFTYNNSTQSGYVRSDLLNISTTAATTSATTSNTKTGAVKGTYINIRKEPVTGEKICQLNTGHSVTISEEQTGSDGKKWYYVTFTYSGTMQSGWICSDFLTVEETATTTSSTDSTAGTIKGTSVRIRESAVNGTVVCQLNTGHAITKTGETKGSDGYSWYQIKFSYNNAEKTGWVRSDFVTMAATATSTISDADFETSISGFPETYRVYLRTLHSTYPNWQFQPISTGLEWADAVNAECTVGKNLISSSAAASWKSTDSQAYDWTTNSWYGFDGSSWVAASPEIIKFYMDSRNFLDDSGIFQFETLEKQSYQTDSGVSNLLSGTFMSGNYSEPDGSSKSYVATFIEAGTAVGINPYHLAARCYQEQGTGNGGSISGTVDGYNNLFNFFNVGAYASGGNSSLINGLIYASGSDSGYYRPWNTRYASIMGGAKYLAEKFVSKGQNTLYFQKFNVVNSSNGIYSHQYMANLQAAASEATKMKKAYSDLNASLVFKIPIYNNMPDSACTKPSSTSNPNNYLSGLAVDGYQLVPVFSGAVTDYYVTVDNSITSVNISAAAVASTSSIGGTGTVSLNQGNNVFQVVCQSQSGNARTYNVTVTRQ